MSRAKTVAIDGEKLRKLIEATGRILPDASQELGYSRKWLTETCKSNRATAQGMSLIALMFNIPQELYVLPDETDPEQTQEEITGFNNEKLDKISRQLEEIIELLKREPKQQSWELPFLSEEDRKNVRL